MPKNITQTKSDMGYIENPAHPCCSNCTAFSSTIVEQETRYGVYKDEKNLRCTLGNFATKKQATCSKHEFITK